MKKKNPLKAIDTTELEFMDKKEYLEWRKKILNEYEQSKINYKEEMNKLFGYDDDKKDWFIVYIIINYI